jgi:hypothetical protein
MSTVAVNPGLGGTRRATAAGRPVAGSSAVRLTRRGRLLVTVVFLAILLAALTMFGSHSAATGESGVPVKTHMVEVGRGDTLWGLASEVAPPGKVGETVIKIRELNALSDSKVAVGQEIAVPLG